MNINANFKSKFLSEVISEIPSNCLFNKGVTGCGGTTLEIEAKRDSIIVVPNINLVVNKVHAYPHLIGVYGDVSVKEFLDKFQQQSNNKKIIVTYDSLPKVINWLETFNINPYKFFLLIDEYHILFNSYGFRYKAISYILQNFKKFDNYCFMTATPLADYNILEELKDLPQVIINWPQAVPVKVEVHNTFFTSKELFKLINESINKNENLHIFINSINTIRSIINKINTEDYRTICSKNAENKDKTIGKLKVKSINSNICKVNFYTATAFEGVDIYDPIGKTVVVSDTNISQSLVDISTLFIQICGRLRDSIYKNQVIFICNTSNHRYLKYKTDNEFNLASDQLKRNAIIYGEDFLTKRESSKKIDLDAWNETPEFYQGRYIGSDSIKLYYDPNLKKIDKQNFDVITKVFCNTVSILNNLNATSKVDAQIKKCRIISKNIWNTTKNAINIFWNY